MKINKESGLILAVIFLNSWIWKISQLNILMFFLVIMLTLLICRYTFKKTDTKIILLSITILILMASLLIAARETDSDIWNLNQTERFTLNQRRQLYPYDLGKLVQNKINLSFFKFKRNLFDNLDPNLYFFAGHPRERSGIHEFEKFPFIFLAFFVIGFIDVIIRTNYFFIFFTLGVFLMSSFIDPASRYGPILTFPIICLVILNGILRVIRLLETRKLTLK